MRGPHGPRGPRSRRVRCTWDIGPARPKNPVNHQSDHRAQAGHKDSQNLEATRTDRSSTLEPALSTGRRALAATSRVLVQRNRISCDSQPTHCRRSKNTLNTALTAHEGWAVRNSYASRDRARKKKTETKHGEQRERPASPLGHTWSSAPLIVSQELLFGANRPVWPLQQSSCSAASVPSEKRGVRAHQDAHERTTTVGQKHPRRTRDPVRRPPGIRLE